MLTLTEVLRIIDVSLPIRIIGSNNYRLEDIPQESQLWGTPVTEYGYVFNSQVNEYECCITVLFD